MAEHRHRYKHEITVRLVCDCGAEGEPCEACTNICDLAGMGTDAGGYRLCTECCEKLAEEARKDARRVEFQAAVDLAFGPKEGGK